jgi:hypothetical protein
MTEPVVCQERAEIRGILFQVEIPDMSLWNQLDLARQKQMAQLLAEMIRRIRGNPCQERSNDEGE